MDDDTLDGCDITPDESTATADSDLAGVVLFADIDPTDPAAVAARTAEWAEVLA